MSEWKEVNSTNGQTIINSVYLSKFVGKDWFWLIFGTCTLELQEWTPSLCCSVGLQFVHELLKYGIF